MAIISLGIESVITIMNLHRAASGDNNDSSANTLPDREDVRDYIEVLLVHRGRNCGLVVGDGAVATLVDGNELSVNCICRLAENPVNGRYTTGVVKYLVLLAIAG